MRRSEFGSSIQWAVILGLLTWSGAGAAAAQHVHGFGCSIACGGSIREAGGSAFSGLPSLFADDTPIASPFRIAGRWDFTATDGTSTGERGDPITLTYGVVPDGTFIGPRSGQPAGEGTGPSGLNSNLQNFLNNWVGPEATWSALIDDAYQRWGEISGLTMIREHNDDGSTMGGSGSLRGLRDVRADIRIGGRYIDGQAGNNVLAYNFLPSNGDLVADTGNFAFYGNSTNNYRALRNVFMHEAGHGLGFAHLQSNNSNALMEPFNNNSFDGPQHDDILAAQRNYGDALEKNGGNDDITTATYLGSLTPMPMTAPTASLAIGTDAQDHTTFVGANQTDFVSIDGGSDKDWYGFTLDARGQVTVQLDPRGPTYHEGPEGGTQSLLNTKALADLVVQLHDSTGGFIAIGNLTGAGFGETISRILEAGDYYAFIRTQAGSANDVQMYELNISAVLIPEPASWMVFAGLVGVGLGRRRSASPVSSN